MKKPAASGLSISTNYPPMRRYILRQYLRGEPSHDPANVTGTFDELKTAQAFAGMRLRDFNEIIDQNAWEVVWRFNRSASNRSTALSSSPLHAVLELADKRQPAAWFN